MAQNGWTHGEPSCGCVLLVSGL